MRRIPWILAAAAPLLLGGCPQPTPVEHGETYILPGEYWVERRGPLTFIYRIPDERGISGIWIPIHPQDNTWYVGDGLYSLSPDQYWTLQISAAQTSLDEILLLNDPPPAVPDALDDGDAADQNDVSDADA